MRPSRWAAASKASLAGSPPAGLENAMSTVEGSRAAASRRRWRSSIASARSSVVSSDAFDVDAHLEGLAELARLGVTWVQVGLPGDSVEHAVEVAQRYGEQVIATSRRTSASE